jgi:hypothetical protein
MFSGNELMRSVLGRLEHNASHFAVFKLWDDLAPTYAPRSRALGLKGRKLVVGVPSHAHQHQLTLSKKQILQRINQALGKSFLQEVIFQITTQEKEMF